MPEPITLRCLIDDVHPAALKMDGEIVGHILKLQLCSNLSVENFETLLPEGKKRLTNLFSDRGIKSLKLYGCGRDFNLTFITDEGEVLLTMPAALAGADPDFADEEAALFYIPTTLHFHRRLKEGDTSQALLTGYLKRSLKVQICYDQAELPLSDPIQKIVKKMDANAKKEGVTVTFENMQTGETATIGAKREAESTGNGHPRLYFKKGETPAEFLARIMKYEEQGVIETTYAGKHEICVEILDGGRGAAALLKDIAGNSFIREEVPVGSESK